jgi:ubiquinone/menaquinone biosynthesis C-methylase UbiE
VLEYGCGTGSNAYDLARAGATVVGIDISPGSVDIAHRRSVADGLDDRIEFRVMNAEKLEFPDNSFDVICGTGILHHLDLERGYREILRVLKPGGYAVFTEPLGHNPLINMYRNRTPDIRTPDEHPLLAADLETARRIFPRVEFRHFHILSLGSVLFARTPLFKPVYAIAELVDRTLMRVIPPLRKMAWIVVLTMRK